MLQSGFIVNLFKEFQVIVRWGNDPVSFCIDKAPLAIDFDAGGAEGLPLSFDDPCLHHADSRTAFGKRACSRRCA